MEERVKLAVHTKHNGHFVYIMSKGLSEEIQNDYGRKNLGDNQTLAVNGRINDIDGNNCSAVFDMDNITVIDVIEANQL